MHLNWGKLLKYHLKGKTSRKLVNGQNIDYSETKKAEGLHLPLHWGLNTIIFKHVNCWYMQQISGERLQDHWSSGFLFLTQNMYLQCMFCAKNNNNNCKYTFLQVLIMHRSFVSPAPPGPGIAGT